MSQGSSDVAIARDQAQSSVTAALESSGNPEHLPRDPLPRHEVFEDQDKENVHAQVNDVLLIALRDSKLDVPPLIGGGVSLFRLTRNARSLAVDAILLRPVGPLAALHRRVVTTGSSAMRARI